jgi:hypothetical protein
MAERNAKRRPGNPNVAEAGKPYRWKKGQSGNPNGVKAGYQTMAKRFRNSLDKKASKIPALKARCKELGMCASKSTIGEVLAMSLIVDAIGGGVQSAQEVLNRSDGKIREILGGGNGELGSVDVSLANVSEEQLDRTIRKKTVKKVVRRPRKATSRSGKS